MTSLKTSIKTITYLSDIGCLEIQGASLMTQVSPGVIKARYQTRNHVAEVRITYTATYYNIKYDSSLNLQASDGKIHKNYNRWVRNLDKDIQVNLSTGATL